MFIIVCRICYYSSSIFLGTGPGLEVCNTCHSFSLWYGVVLRGCAVRGDDFRELLVSPEQHPRRGN